MIDKTFRAEYISDIHDDFLKKGQIYECWETKIPGIYGYRDDHGECYGVPADRFRIIEE